MVTSFSLVLLSIVFYIEKCSIHSFSLPSPSAQTRSSNPTAITQTLFTQLYSSNDNNDQHQHLLESSGRRTIFEKTSQGLLAGAVTLFNRPSPSNAASKSRTDGYKIQHTEREWSYILSGQQYNILRVGGTERPNTSILEGEERDGKYICAGCRTPLFASSAKFHSGTGWPSFASSFEGVETESVNLVQAGLLGAEVRCTNCGGHLGDVFGDGILYVNTPAFITRKRFCVDGSALIFTPTDGTEDVYGDLKPPTTPPKMPDFLAPPKIVSKER